LDATADAAKRELVDESSRIGKLTGNYAQIQIAKLRAAEAAARLEQEQAEAKRVAELKRIEDERRIAQEKIDAENRAKLEAAAKLNKAKRAEEEARLQAEIDRQKALAEAETMAARDKINDEAGLKNYKASQLVLDAQPTQAKGQTFKEDWELNVFDSYALARAHPSCVNITPKVSEIKALLDQGIEVQGVKATRIAKSSVRATSRTVDV
jgi:hypothetical protein